MVEAFPEVAEAFSRVAEKYDLFAQNNPNLARIRTTVYNHITQYLEPGAHILELNAGSGTDAVHMAQQGYRVTAIDIAPGMLKRFQEKVRLHGLQEMVDVRQGSFTNLEEFHGKKFNAIFSNMGGLNCIPDLRLVARSLLELLYPEGLVTWVLMPPICLWELALFFSGNFRVAFRRLSPYGTIAHLEGRHFRVYYHSPTKALSAFGSQFTCLRLEGLSVFAPPAESKNFAIRHPHFYRLLCWLDKSLAKRHPFSSWGDFYILSLKYSGKPID